MCQPGRRLLDRVRGRHGGGIPPGEGDAGGERLAEVAPSRRGVAGQVLLLVARHGVVRRSGRAAQRVEQAVLVVGERALDAAGEPRRDRSEELVTPGDQDGIRTFVGPGRAGLLLRRRRFRPARSRPSRVSREPSRPGSGQRARRLRGGW